MTTVGIDIGTSSVKVALVAADDRLVAYANRALAVSRPHSGWSEQDPHAWWDAVVACMDELRATHGAALAGASAIGLSGQMHGATLLDDHGDRAPPVHSLERRAQQRAVRAPHARMAGAAMPSPETSRCPVSPRPSSCG